jgi:hypothetical protein
MFIVEEERGDIKGGENSRRRNRQIAPEDDSVDLESQTLVEINAEETKSDDSKTKGEKKKWKKMTIKEKMRQFRY